MTRSSQRLFFYRDAMRRHLASMLFVIAFTRASCAAQKARLPAAVRILGPRFAAGATGKAASKTNGTETAAANGEPAAARWARARPQYVMDRGDMISSPCPARYFIRARQRSPPARRQAWPR